MTQKVLFNEAPTFAELKQMYFDLWGKDDVSKLCKAQLAYRIDILKASKEHTFQEIMELINNVNHLFNKLTDYEYATLIDWEFEDYEIVRFHLWKWIVLTKNWKLIDYHKLERIYSMLIRVEAWWRRDEGVLNWDDEEFIPCDDDTF